MVKNVEVEFVVNSFYFLSHLTQDLPKFNFHEKRPHSHNVCLMHAGALDGCVAAKK